MNKAVEQGANELLDRLQQRLTDYALGLEFERLPPAVVHAAKVRIIDTLGALVGGFLDEPCRIARSVAADMQTVSGSTVIGTSMITSPEMAAFVNSTTSRSVEMNDVAHKAGGRNGHPSDVIGSVLAVAEHAHSDGRDFITAVVLAYEVYLRLAESISTPAFDAANFCCIGTAAAAGRLLGLDAARLAHCLSMAAVPNNALNQTRTGQLSMWKAVASGQAGRAGVYAALLARKGMEGPYLPFEGKHGWCNHVALKSLSLETMGGNGVPFRIEDTVIKPRAACFHTLAPILAAEKAATLLRRNVTGVTRVSIENYQAKERSSSNIGSAGGGASQHWWNPQSRETADHSIPYCVAATLLDGTVDQTSFDDAHLWNPGLRALLKKIEVVENAEFTAGYESWPVRHRCRITVALENGEHVVGESGGEFGDLSDTPGDEEIARKFRSLTEEALGARRVSEILDRLWHLEDMPDTALIPPAFVLG